MLAKFGFNADAYDNKIYQPVIWDSNKVINGHCLFVGMSGSGKSHTLRAFIEQFTRPSNSEGIPLVHVYDAHGDMSFPYCSTVMFSEQTNYGINPLQVNPDPHFGGVRKAINHFTSTLNQCMRSLGVRQETCIRNLLQDLYARHGFIATKPETWTIRENETRMISDGADSRIYIDCPLHEKESLKALEVDAKYDATLRSWWIPIHNYHGAVTRWPPKKLNRTNPNIGDLLHYARHVHEKAFLGADSETITNIEIHHKICKQYHNKIIAAAKSNSEFKDIPMLEKIEVAGDKAIASFTEYVNCVKTGKEIKEVLKYESGDTLKSVIGRLESMDAMGIFRPTPPTFDPSSHIRRYDIRALGQGEERKLFVLFHMAQLFEKNSQLGETTTIREVLVLDEAHLYADENPDNPINKIAKEGRKYGIALLCASQSPTHFTDDFIASVSTKVILGIDESYWKSSAAKLNLSLSHFDWIIHQKRMLVQIKAKGNAKSTWTKTIIDLRTPSEKDIQAYNMQLSQEKTKALEPHPA